MIKLVIMITVLVLSIPVRLFSGPVWIKNYGVNNTNEIGSSITCYSPGIFYISGSTNSSGTGYYDGYLVKIDSSGDTLFTRTYGGINDDRFNSITVFRDTLLAVAGYTNSFGAGDYDFFLIVLNENGDTIWSRTFGGSGDDKAYEVIPASDSTLIITGYTESFKAGERDVYLIKVNLQGDIVWSTTAGGINNDIAYSVCQLPGGDIVICGYTESCGQGMKDVLIMGFSEQGDSLWVKTIGGMFSDWANSIIIFDNYLYLAGATESFGSGFWDCFVIKCDINGESIWTRAYGGIYREEVNQIISHLNGDLWLTGWTESYGSGYTDIILISIDTSGNENWFNNYGTFTYERGNALIITADNGCILVAEIWDLHWDDYNLYLIKTDSTGVTTGVEEQLILVDYNQNKGYIINRGLNTLRFSVIRGEKPYLKIFDSSGRELPIEPLTYYNKGQYQARIDFSSVGIYFYSLEFGQIRKIGKIIVIE